MSLPSADSNACAASVQPSASASSEPTEFIRSRRSSIIAAIFLMATSASGFSFRPGRYRVQYKSSTNTPK